MASSGVAGQTLTFTTDNTRLNTDLVQLLQAQYQELGINVQIETVDSADYFSLIKDDTIPWGPANWTPRADPDGLLRILWHSTGFQNSNGYNNPEVDRLLDEAAGIYDTEQAAEIYHEVGAHHRRGRLLRLHPGTGGVRRRPERGGRVRLLPGPRATTPLYVAEPSDVVAEEGPRC